MSSIEMAFVLLSADRCARSWAKVRLLTKSSNRSVVWRIWAGLFGRVTFFCGGGLEVEKNVSLEFFGGSK